MSSVGPFCVASGIRAVPLRETRPTEDGAADHTAGVTIPHDAVVLAYGAAQRLGGADKPGVRVGGRALLDRVLAACRGADRTVVVGDPRATVHPVLWTREDPPGGGPLAALDAGVRKIGASTGTATATRTAAGSGTGDRGGDTGADVLLVLSADLPFLDEDTVQRLIGALVAAPDAEAALLTDSGGRDQPLVAAYRAAPLRRELARIAEERGTLAAWPAAAAHRSAAPHPGPRRAPRLLRLRHLGGHRHGPGPHQGAWDRAG